MTVMMQDTFYSQSPSCAFHLLGLSKLSPWLNCFFGEYELIVDHDLCWFSIKLVPGVFKPKHLSYSFIGISVCVTNKEMNKRFPPIEILVRLSLAGGVLPLQLSCQDCLYVALTNHLLNYSQQLRKCPNMLFFLLRTWHR